MKKEKLVYSNSRWEIAHVAINQVTGKEQWERRDSSYICDVDSTEFVQEMPKKPTYALGGMHLSDPNSFKGAKGPND